MKKFSLIGLTMLCLGILTVSVVSARVVSSDKVVNIAADEVVDEDLFIAGEQVNIDGTVNGDVYAAGGNISVTGTINGDLIAAGGMIEISGKVADDVRVAAGTVEIRKAIIGDNLSIAGGSLRLDAGSTVGGSAIFAGGVVYFDGSSGGSLIGSAGSVLVKGKVAKDALFVVGALTVDSQAQVDGDLVYMSDQSAVIAESAQVIGKIEQVMPKEAQQQSESWRGFANGAAQALKLWSYLSSLVVGMLLIYLFGKPAMEIAEVVGTHTAASFLWGGVTMFLVMPLVIILMMSVIGIPMALILGGLFILGMYLANIFVAVFWGKVITKSLNLTGVNLYLSFAIGLFAYFVLTLVPILGSVIVFAVGVLGFGALLYYLKSQFRSQPVRPTTWV